MYPITFSTVSNIQQFYLFKNKLQEVGELIDRFYIDPTKHQGKEINKPSIDPEERMYAYVKGEGVIEDVTLKENFDKLVTKIKNIEFGYYLDRPDVIFVELFSLKSQSN